MKSHESTGISFICLPLIFLLLSSLPWQRDSRRESELRRLFTLQASHWSWDRVQFAKLLPGVDINQYHDGVPVFVLLALKENDPEFLERMIAQGANLNTADWGCTPLLALLDASERDPLAIKLIRAGADVNLLPTEASIKARRATGTRVCESFDKPSKERRRSLLRVFFELSDNVGILELLIGKGARPSGQVDAQEILDEIEGRSSFLRYNPESIRRLAIEHGALPRR